MSRDLEVQNPAPMVLDHREAVQHTEGQRRNFKEAERRDHLGLIVHSADERADLFVGSQADRVDGTEVARTDGIRAGCQETTSRLSP